MAILPNTNDNVTISYDNPWAPYESIAIGSSGGGWGNGTIDGTIYHNYSYNYDKLWEYLFYAIIDRELDESKRKAYQVVLQLNKNDYRNTVLQIEIEKNEELPS